MDKINKKYYKIAHFNDFEKNNVRGLNRYNEHKLMFKEYFYEVFNYLLENKVKKIKSGLFVQMWDITYTIFKNWGVNSMRLIILWYTQIEERYDYDEYEEQIKVMNKFIDHIVEFIKNKESNIC